MTSEFHACTKKNCYIRQLVDIGYLSFWPLRERPELSNDMYHQWEVYIKFNETRGSRVRLTGITVCTKHHNQILRMAEEEMAYDVREQEATDRWLAKNSRL